jgi:endonuclease/exonuclease/phosphatase family metal-dependent hydrolase
VVTLNTAKVTESQEIVRQLTAAPHVRNATVLLLQEVAHAQGRPTSVADEIAASLKMNVAYAPAGPGVADQGLAVLSRYPLRDIRIVPLCRYDLLWHSRARFALSVTVATPAGDIRISNAHLDTRVNASDRVRQLEDALKDDPPGAAARIVAGDFNTNNFYWLFHALPLPVPQIQTAALRQSLAKRGFASALGGSTATFDHLGMQLDWVFARGLRVRNTAVVPMQFSDHHALWAELTIDPKL